jgi:hypothetical protein
MQTLNSNSTAVKNAINTINANTSKLPGFYPSKTSVLALLADAGFAEEWSTTTHPTHVVLKIAKIYNEHKDAAEDIWNDDAAMQACIAEVEEHADLADLVDYINNVALQNTVFVYDCLCCSGL